MNTSFKLKLNIMTDQNSDVAGIEVSYTTLFLETPFGKLGYRVDGPADAAPILILQRFRGTMDDWDPPFVEALARTHKIIRFDSAGLGESEGVTPTTIAEMADVAVAFADAFGLMNFDLFGWSIGGYVAQMVALEITQRIKKLIIAGSGPGGITEGPRPHERVAEIAGKEVIPQEDFRFLFFPESPAGIEFGEGYIKRLFPEGRYHTMVKIESANRQRQAVVSWWKGENTARPRLSELKMPILVANGVSDVMVPAYSAYVISQEAPYAKLVLYPDSGHGFLFQVAEEFVAEIECFLAS
jgi:pimeloyl-ACP methyl ester carboxylesterase